MPSIVITEVDNTSAGVVLTQGDAAYVPGFALTKVEPQRKYVAGEKYVKGEYVKVSLDGTTYNRYGVVNADISASDTYNLSKVDQYLVSWDLPDHPATTKEIDPVPANGTYALVDGKYYTVVGTSWSDELEVVDEPEVGQFGVRLCTTVDEFKQYFGDTPAVFEADQSWPSNTVESTAYQFSQSAYKENSVMYNKGDADKSYLYALELIAAGIPVYYERVNPVLKPTEATASTQSITVQQMYNEFLKVTSPESESIFERLADKGDTDIKFITTGGYPVFEYANNAVVSLLYEVCAGRGGDSYVLIDHTDYYERPLGPKDNKSVYYVISQDTARAAWSEYGTMVTPWYNAVLAQSGVTTSMPGSFAYLMCKAYCLTTGARWASVAGAARGSVPNLVSPNTKERLTNKIADDYQPRNKVSINPITKVEPYGYLIWGNRTLKNNATAGNLTATSFLNVRDLLCDIKKQAYIAARRYMFEQNSDVLWVNFKSVITPVLENMQASYVLKNYSFRKLATSEKGKLKAQIIVKPIYAVESFEIEISIEDDDVTVS